MQIYCKFFYKSKIIISNKMQIKYLRYSANWYNKIVSISNCAGFTVLIPQTYQFIFTLAKKAFFFTGVEMVY